MKDPCFDPCDGIVMYIIALSAFIVLAGIVYLEFGDKIKKVFKIK